MKKLRLPLLAILLFTACQKETSAPRLTEEFGDVAQKVHENKIKVCHFNAETGTSHTITINENAWPAHQAHGDVLGDCSESITTTICDQVWMVKNLDVTTYRNGDPIPEVTNPTEWVNLTTGAWCYFENNSANGTVYGKLYNWYAVNDSRGLAPAGWHVPSDEEWTILSDCLGGELVAGGAMKSTGTLEAGTGLWLSPNTGATNSSGFSGLPGGFREVFVGGNFGFIGFVGYWWSSKEEDTNNAFDRNMNSLTIDITRGTENKRNGFSVRCIRD
jgi:uncharacterized protein (TIGR02145 family)